MADKVVEHKIEFTGDASKLQAACTQAAQAITGLGTVTTTGVVKVDKFGDSITKLGSKLSSLGSSLSIGITAPLALLGKQLFTSAANFEQIAVSFEVFTGSAEVAKNMLGQLKDMALKSPMQFQDITKGAQTLLGYGLTAQQVIPITQRLGDISGGNSEKFNRLALAFGQVNAAGRLMGQEARQMINAGFNPLQAIADTTGISMAELTKRMHDGQISVQDVADAMKYATSEGGRFYGMLDKQSQTLQGQFNKLQESITFAFAEIGKSLAEASGVQKFFTWMSAAIETLKNKFLALSPETKESIVKFGAFLAILGPAALIIGGTISAISNLVTAVTTLRIAVMALAASTGWGIVIAAIGAIAVACGLGISKMNDFGDSVNDTLLKSHNAINQFKIESLAETINKLKSQISNLQKNKIDPTQGIFTTAQGEAKLKQLKIELTNVEKIYEKIANVKFNNNPPSKTGPTPPQPPVEIFTFNDYWTKEYGNKLKALVKENIEAGKTISNWWEDNDVKRLKQLKADYEAKLEIVQKEFEGKKDITNKGEIEINNITAKYQADRLAILRKGSEQEISARDRARKVAIEDPFKQIVIDDAKKKVGSFNQVWDSLVAGDKANSMRELSTSLYAAMKDFGVNITVGFGELVGAAITGGLTFQEAFQALTKLILNSVGDLLIQAGTAAIKFGLFKDGIEAALTASGIGGGAAVAIGLAAVAAGTALKALSSKQEKSLNQPTAMQLPTSTKATGSSYQYGGSSYSTQSIRLSIDLTGSITQTQTGYQINKSLETVARVTGR